MNSSCGLVVVALVGCFSRAPECVFSFVLTVVLGSVAFAEEVLDVQPAHEHKRRGGERGR